MLANFPKISGLMLCLTFASPVFAQSACDGSLGVLQTASGAGDAAASLQAWAQVQAAGCDEPRLRAARAQVSALMARAAQGALSAGDIAGAEAFVLQAPGVHWAVQAVKGDIAAKRGDRSEAARMYNAAIDTLGDPVQTPQSEALVPVAERLLALAQENMMLAGSMDSSVTRGGGASGVMGVAARGLAIERDDPKPAPVEAYVPPKAPAGYVPPPPPAGYVPPKAEEYVAPAETYAPEPTPAYNVITAAAAKVNSVFLPIRFGFDSDQLDATGIREGLRLAEFLIANKVGTVVITGHTDDVGSEAYNLDLSFRRANSLGLFLQSYGVASRISIVGKGEAEPPLYSNAQAYSLEELRTIARRVEVAFGY
jgi:outer membrane protein OmpA-like peptidoglycan-associated protein